MSLELFEIEIAAELIKAKYPSADAKEAIEAFLVLLHQPRFKDKIHLFFKINKKLFEEPKP